MDTAEILKAFGEHTRLRILRLIARQELSVTELVDALDVPQSRISRHLAILRQAGIVCDRREGNWIYYRLAGDASLPGAIWQAVSAHVTADSFYPADLQRLEAAVTRREQRTQEYFEVVQDHWDRIRRDYIDDALSFLVISSLIRPEAVVADVGTGTGELLGALSETAAHVIGIDRSEKMLAACRARIDRDRLPNIELLQAPAEHLPLPDGTCDTAFSSMLLHHLADPVQGISELTRIVRPGGRVVISDLVTHDQDWTREVMADVWLGFDEKQIRDWLGDAGLTAVSYTSTPVPSPRAPSAQGKLRAFLATGVKPAVPTIDTEAASRGHSTLREEQGANVHQN